MAAKKFGKISDPFRSPIHEKPKRIAATGAAMPTMGTQTQKAAVRASAVTAVMKSRTAATDPPHDVTGAISRVIPRARNGAKNSACTPGVTCDR